MSQFLSAVGEDPRSSARIVSVSGEPGAGKSRFVEEALGRLAQSGRPVTTVRPELSPGMDGMQLLRAFAAKLPIGGAMLAGAVSRFHQGGPTVQLDESSARALLNGLFHEVYDCGVDRRGLIRPKFQRLALVLDDFDLLPAGIASWLADTFLPRLDEVRGHLDYMLILVGERSLANDPDPVAWNAQPMRFLSIEVPPMSEEESVELLSLFARRSAEARTCHQLGEGLPGAMIELLRHRIRPMEEMAGSVERQSGAVAEALLAVAILGFGTTEGLRLVLGLEAAEAAGELLGSNTAVPVFGSLRNGGLWLPGAIARLVVEKLGPRLPAVAQRAEDVAEMLDGLAQYFPSEQDRTTAVRLGVFHCFNRPALVACFGKTEGENLESFARGHGSGFIETSADNLRFADGLPPLLDRYAEALAESSRSALREKANRLWTEREQELEGEQKAAAEGVARLEKDRGELLRELEGARAQTVQRVDENQREWRSRIDEDVVRVGASLLANGAGVACFWMALFTTSQRMTFIVFGGILIGIGIGTPAFKRGKKPSRVDHAAITRRKQEERVAQSRGVVAMLEARIAGLQQRLAEDRRKLEKLRAAADEPYV
ncbi:MAG: ATP-binding protein [Opitutaceae bacterium]|nr:ATP-binding protein [Opitutaceae bacterium]